MRSWLNRIGSKITALTSAKTDDVAWRETAAMVYVGDIYAVLLRDRAARRSMPVAGHDQRRDASWPFIR